MAITAQNVVTVARQMIEAQYYQWNAIWPPYDGAPFWMTGDVSVNLVLENGTNCAGFINAVCRILGLDALGGTGSIGDYLLEIQDFDASTPAVPGAVALRPWMGGVGNLAEGHVALYTGEHRLIQADHRGVNEDDNDYDSQSWAGFTVYGLLPDVDYSSQAPVLAHREPWQIYGWYEAVNAQWDLEWRPPEKG